jgi:hypothetical protein
MKASIPATVRATTAPIAMSVHPDLVFVRIVRSLHRLLDVLCRDACAIIHADPDQLALPRDRHSFDAVQLQQALFRAIGAVGPWNARNRDHNLSRACRALARTEQDDGRERAGYHRSHRHGLSHLDR